MTSRNHVQIDTLVIGGGQAGLAVGYHLKEASVPFLIVDANPRTGDAWRNRWDSLRLFTPNQFNNLPGMSIPGEKWGFPTKDEVADYLETYAQRFEFDIRHGTRIERLERIGDVFVATAGKTVFEADNVVVAMASYQEPHTPAFAGELDEDIVQLHVNDYRNPSQLRDGAILIVGLGNSGAEIAKELAPDHEVWVAGRPSGVQPFRPEGVSGRLLMPFVGKVVLNRVLATSTPMGRKFKSKMIHKGGPLLRVKPKDLVAAGVHRVGRVDRVEDGSPILEDGTVLDVGNVIWCTGFGPGFSWIHLPVFGEDGEVAHERGVVAGTPGLYFVGLKFQYSALSDTLFCASRDASFVVDHLASARSRSRPAESMA